MNATDPTGKACYPNNFLGQFCRNASRYSAYDRYRRNRRYTNFFAAAAAVSDNFGSFDLMFGVPRLFTSQNTRAHFRAINAKVRGVNDRIASQMRSGTFRSRGSIEANDRALVNIEQSAVQGYLDDLSASSPDQYNDLISNVNSLLNGDGGVGKGASGILDPRVAAAADRTREALGRDIDYANQSDREMLGNELVGFYRSQRSCNTAASRLC